MRVLDMGGFIRLAMLMLSGLICLLLPVRAVLAEAGAPDDAVSALMAFQSGLRSFSAQFEQTTFESDGYVLETVQGQCYFQAPNQFRFAYTPPNAELIVGDGIELWHFDPLLEQATVRAQADMVDIPILLMTDTEYLLANYSVELAPDVGVVQLLPKDPGANVEKLLIAMANGSPTSISWQDPFGQITEIRLSEVKINPDLEADLFAFTPPANVDVFEGR